MNGFCCATSSRIQCCKRIIRNWKKLNGGTHHANPNDNYCNAGRYWRNRSRQRGSSRSVVRRVLPLPSPSLLRLLPVSSLPSLLAPLAPLVLALAGGPNSKAVGDTRQRLCFRPQRAVPPRGHDIAGFAELEGGFLPTSSATRKGSAPAQARSRLRSC